MPLPAPLRAAALAAAACAIAILAGPYLFPRLRACRVEPMLLLGDGVASGAQSCLGARGTLRALGRQVTAASGVPCPVAARLGGGPLGLVRKSRCDALVRSEPFVVDRLSERTTDYNVWAFQGGLYAAAALPAGFLRTWLSVARLSALAVSLGYGDTVALGEAREGPSGKEARTSAKGTGKGRFLLVLDRKRVMLILEPVLSTFQQAVN